MDRCPNCRARTDAEPTCRRCGMELALLQRVEQAADAALQEAIGRLVAGERAAAQSAIRQALVLRRTPLAEGLAGFVGRESTLGPTAAARSTGDSATRPSGDELLCLPTDHSGLA